MELGSGLLYLPPVELALCDLTEVRLFFAKRVKVCAIFLDYVDSKCLHQPIHFTFFAYSAASAGKGKLKSSYLGSESFLKLVNCRMARMPFSFTL